MRTGAVTDPRSPRAVAAALTLGLTLGTGAARADMALGTGAPGADDLAPGTGIAPGSERDLAYERGLQAELAGDDATAAASFERAYRLTAPAESGPRLLFLRASVAAGLRVDGGAAGARTLLCRAEALLRDHLAGAPTRTAAPDPLAEERASLQRVEQRLADIPGPTCAALVGPGEATNPTVPATTSSTSPPTTPSPATAPPSTSPGVPLAVEGEASPSPGSVPAGAPEAGPGAARPRLPARTRALWIAGGASLGLGAAAFATMAAGVVVAREAEARGQEACLTRSCNTNSAPIQDIVADGRRADLMVRTGAVLGGLGVLAGVVMFAVGERSRRRARVTLAPHLAPGWVGAGLSGRF